MRRLVLLPVGILLLTGCSLQKIALKSTTGLFSYGVDALYAEPDLKIAEIAMVSNLKLLEGFQRAEPGNKTLLLLLTQGYASYAMAFLEDAEPERASALYRRATEFGLKLLQQTSAYKEGIPEKEADFVERLTKIKKSQVAALFWTAFAWGGWINLNRDDPQAVFDLSKVKAMMERVLQLDEGFFFGSAHLFWGSTYGSIPKMLGGDPEKAKDHFDRALEISEGKFLMAQVYYARYYAVTTLNEELFTELLNDVLKAPENILPGFELLTSLAKHKAGELLAKKEEIL